MELRQNQPWAYFDPRSLVSKGSCLVMTTDSSDTVVAVSLFRVLNDNASTVTKDDLLDPKLSQLVSVAYKKLDTCQVKWHTCEVELYAIALGCEKK